MLTDAILHQAIDGGLLSRISPDELLPDARKQYDALAKKAEATLHKQPELFLASQKPGAPVDYNITTKEGTPVVAVNEGAHRWTPEYVREHILKSNDQLTEMVNSGQLKDARKEGLSTETYARYAALSKKEGLRETPVIYVSHTGNPDEKDPAPLAWAEQTKEGKPYVIINEAALKKLTPDQFLAAVGGHENDHILRGDTTPEGLAAIHNNPALASQVERRADIEGSLMACDPKSLEEALAIGHKLDAAQYMKLKPGKTEADFVTAMEQNDPLHHPRTSDRVEALEVLQKYLIKHPDGACEAPDYNQLPTPTYIRTGSTMDAGTPSRPATKSL